MMGAMKTGQVKLDDGLQFFPSQRFKGKDCKMLQGGNHQLVQNLNLITLQHASSIDILLNLHRASSAHAYGTAVKFPAVLRDTYLLEKKAGL